MRKLATALLALCLAACSNSDDIKSGSDTGQRAPLREAEFNFNAKEFARAFNSTSNQLGKPYRIDHIDIRNGAVHDYFQQVFAPGVSITAAISKDSGRIISVTALIGSEGMLPLPDRDTLLALAEIVASATNPALNHEKASALAKNMLDESFTPGATQNFPQRFLNDVRYVLRNDRGVGYWWITNPA